MQENSGLPNIKIVLVEPSHPGNIGSAARAMKVMGLSNLALVKPKLFPDGKAKAMAAGADDILENVQIFDSFNDAIADCLLVFGMSARKRRISSELILPEKCAKLVAENHNSLSIGLIFGREHSGLTNAELDRCHYAVNIPTAEDFSSLNLGAAVQVICYELRKTIFTYSEVITKPLKPSHMPASAQDMELFFEHLKKIITATGFLRPENPKKLMRRIRKLFNKAEPDQNEINILRGILSSVEMKIDEER
ncbi:MAG: RNA methyltransferase [Gammaproteobacteria bacterium]|nr:MAG: RNA methyltransferase [Gammaproteobacteria bacterium]